MASGGGKSEPTFVSRNAARRLVRDVRDVMVSPLDGEGIYYQHDPEDMLKGYAMIVGPPDTAYEDGFYLFTFEFGGDYPDKPPVVRYWTNDGDTRFNPNLYKSGKVCVSILNTWKGEQWSGCQNIRSVLLTLCTLLNDNPLLNEPGVAAEHPDVPKYRDIIRYKNVQWSMLKQLRALHASVEKDRIVQDWAVGFFGDTMRRLFLDRFDRIRRRTIANGVAFHDNADMATWETSRLQCRVYGAMWAEIAYADLLDDLMIVRAELCSGDDDDTG
jgi:ubiquitin-protein ligase